MRARNPALNEVKLLDPRSLGAAAPIPAAPFRIALDIATPQAFGASDTPPATTPVAHAEVVCERILRVLPGRRLVAQARLSDQPVLLKLFVGRHAARRAIREVAGSRLLTAAGVPTPRVRALVKTAAGEAHGLLIDWLPDIGVLDAADAGSFAMAVTALARLHAIGASHDDLHLGNFVCSAAAPGLLYLVDAGAVRRSRLLRRPTVGASASRADLAALCAQRPAALDETLPAIHAAYCGARGWRQGDADFSLIELRQAVRRARARRVRRYLRKTTRTCSEYHVERARGWRRITVRDLCNAGLLGFLRDPQADSTSATLIKDGNSATVVRIVIDGQSWIVKRYNVRNFWHGVRRALGLNARQRNAWSNGQRLHFLGIPTARPVALLEQRIGPFTGTAYLVMEDLGDRDLLGEGRAGGIDAPLLDRVVELFAQLRAHGLTHGDTKATNFLLANAQSACAPDGDGERQVALIDLDSMHLNARGWRRDCARFLANWSGDPALAQRFLDALRAAGLDPAQG